MNTKDINQDDRLFSIGEVAAMLAVSTKTVRRAIARAEMEHYRIAGVYRIGRDQVRRYKERCLVKATR